MQRTIFLATVFAGLLVGSATFAQTNATTTATSGEEHNPTLAGIVFPIAEFGNCSSKDACRVYCDDTTHADACLAFAQAHKLMSKDEVSVAKKFKDLVGPGGCHGKECKVYCADTTHQAECLAFAQAHGLGPQGHMGAEGEAHATSTAQFLNGTTGPGGCTSSDACRTYCADQSHASECLAFAQEHHLMSSDEVKKAKEIIGATGPGGCKGAECKVYCADTTHQTECLAFAQEHGLIGHEQAQRMHDKNEGTTTPEGAMGSTTFTGQFPKHMRPGMGSTSMRGEFRIKPMPPENIYRNASTTGGGFRGEDRPKPPTPPGGMMPPQGGDNGQGQQGGEDVPPPGYQEPDIQDNGQGQANWTQMPAAVWGAFKSALSAF